MFKFEHLFIEIDHELLEHYTGQTSAVTHNKGLLYNNVDSFCYLSNLAIAQGIPVTPVDDRAARIYFMKNLDRINIDLLTGIRDIFMSKKIKEEFPDTSTGIAFVLCGSKHIPMLTHFLKEQGNYLIISLDIDDNRLKLKIRSIDDVSSPDKVLRKAPIFQDNRELHAYILNAKMAFAVKYGLTESSQPKDNKNKESDEVEKINSEDIRQEVEKPGTCIQGPG